MGSDQLRNGFGKNNTMGPLKGISAFASEIFKLVLFAVCHTSVMTMSLRINIMVFNQTVSSGLMIFFLLITLLPDFELVLLQEIKKLINLESANFKLDP